MAINTPFLTWHHSQGFKYHFQGAAGCGGESMTQQQNPKKEHPEVPDVFSDLGGSLGIGLVARATEGG